MLKLALKVALGVFCVFALLAQSSVAAPPPKPKPVRVVIETDAGRLHRGGRHGPRAGDLDELPEVCRCRLVRRQKQFLPDRAARRRDE